MLRTIRLELARTPDNPDGDREHGYEFRAPLAADGHIDVDEWHKLRQHCTVRRFEPGEDEEHGHLIHTQGRRWVFHYDEEEEPADDETGYRFDSHVFKTGEYVSIKEHDGETRPFRVVSVR